ncbi:MAG TPA: polysaccharide deacetylase family protein [Candidatus Polarisedimenticolaceae bacterium]|nr:polysaccharide deacetylase family protein [Candidatus Polarisedimenticolaceae bacterium]
MLRIPITLAAAVFAAGTLFAAGPARRVAVTIDDLPVVSPTLTDNAAWRRITTDLLAALDEHEVPAVGFVNEKKLHAGDEVDPERVALLVAWLDAGFELGNHTFSHPDLHRVELETFLDDVVRGERVTRPLLAGRERRLVWFRHPYLHTGRDRETREAVHALLDRHGYRVAPVTIDNSEWIFARAYDLAQSRDDETSMKRIADGYVGYMDRKFAYFERQTDELFGRAIPHVLLIHANQLNADHFGRLAVAIRARGYVFVGLDEVLEDEAYRSPDDYFGAGGISWLHRWALTRGKSGEFFRGEPLTPEFVKQAAGVDSE